ncbi:MAG: OadG-related small transporter subunit [Acutalibacteraceae bacterium]|nr:OadG-related small transporter subunit [Acutalibacteraceae bacterium]
MNFNPMNFVNNLRYMGVGMVGIFAVIGVIILVTVLLNKIFSSKK